MTNRAWKWRTNGPLWQILRPQARGMRTEATSAEALLWTRLRKSQVCGVRFRRQHALNRYVVDFFCPAVRLVVEVDGPIHDFQDDADGQRQSVLEKQGFRFLRFTNASIENDLDQVVREIEQAVLGVRKDSDVRNR